VVLSEGHWIGPEHLDLTLQDLKPVPIFNGRGLKEAKAEFEARLVAEVLRTYKGNAQLASKALKISRSMLYNLVKKYNLISCQIPSDKDEANGNQKPLPLRRAYTRRRGIKKLGAKLNEPA
jgi:DNA-binding NtrC family response regulator